MEGLWAVAIIVTLIALLLSAVVKAQRKVRSLACSKQQTRIAAFRTAIASTNGPLFLLNEFMATRECPSKGFYLFSLTDGKPVCSFHGALEVK